MLPLTKLVLEAHALSDLERRDDTSLDLLTGLPCGLLKQVKIKKHSTMRIASALPIGETVKGESWS
jgi:hypothetical protein